MSGSLSGSRGCNPRSIVPNTAASRQRRLRSILLPFQGAGIVGTENVGFHPTLFYPSLSGTRSEIRFRRDMDLHFPFSILHFAGAGSACLCAENLWFSVRSLIQTSEAALAADKPCGRVFHTPRGDQATLTTCGSTWLYTLRAKSNALNFQPRSPKLILKSERPARSVNRHGRGLTPDAFLSRQKDLRRSRPRT